MSKSNKLVGGKRVKLPKYSWTVEAEGITLSGSAQDARSAALDASAARKTITDALKADTAIQAIKDGSDPAPDETPVGAAEGKGRLGRGR